jgi:hypothetical protein
MLLNNHTSVWGSWWSNFQWSFACCHSTVKHSYCTGDAGKEAFGLADRMRTGVDLEEVPKAVAWKEEEALQEHVPNAPDHVEKVKQDATRKSTLKQMASGAEDEDMEEYRRKRTMAARRRPNRPAHQHINAISYSQSGAAVIALSPTSLRRHPRYNFSRRPPKAQTAATKTTSAAMSSRNVDMNK